MPLISLKYFEPISVFMSPSIIETWKHQIRPDELQIAAKNICRVDLPVNDFYRKFYDKDHIWQSKLSNPV
jgi:hypothetical protein